MDYNAPSFSNDPDAEYVGKTGSSLGSCIPPKVPGLLQREMVNAHKASGLTPSNDDRTQLAQGIGRGLWIGNLGASANALVGSIGGGAGGTKPAILQTLNTWTRLRGIALQTNTSVDVTVTISGIGTAGGVVTAPLRKRDGATKPAPGDVPTLGPFEVQWDGTNFRFVGSVASDGVAATALPTLNRPNGLRIATTTTSLIALSANEVVLASDAGDRVLRKGLALTLSSAVVGAGGFDRVVTHPGSFDHYEIFNPSGAGTDNTLSVPEGGTPNLPTGYTFYRKVGWGRTDASGNWLFIIQDGDEWWYKVQPVGGTNTFGPAVVASGSVGCASDGTTITNYVGVSCAGLMPLKSVSIDLALCNIAMVNGYIIVAPNQNYPLPAGTYTSPRFPYLTTQANNQGPWAFTSRGRLTLEEQAKIYLAQQNNCVTAITGGKHNIF